MDSDNISVFNMISICKKNHKDCIGYKNEDYKIKKLHIMLPKTSSYVKGYDGETKWIYFLIEDDELIKKYNEIWIKISISIKKESASEPIYNKKLLKTKIKSYGDEAVDFSDKKMLKVGSNYICLAVILIDFVLIKDENYYYPQVFLKESK